MSAYNRVGVLSLYRNLLKNASKFVNYNFREHAKRRVIGEFKQNKNLSTAEAEAKYTWGLGQSEMVRRQAIVSQLFPQETSVATQVKKVRHNV